MGSCNLKDIWERVSIGVKLMKIKTKEKSYEQVLNLQEQPHKKPTRQSAAIRALLKFLAGFDLRAVDFSYDTVGMERIGKDEPCLILMNHSSFIDLEIAAHLLADREYHIVCTRDGFVGKEALMRMIGCISAKKFIYDTQLVRDMTYTLKELKASVLMYPEASYSFDGTQTPLPESLAKCIRMLKVPVVMIRTEGAFLRDPLYNCLQKRQVNVRARMQYLLSPDEIEQKSVKEIDADLRYAFSYDHFKEQQEKQISVNEPFRADGLHRVLYRCPHCEEEGNMSGEGTKITCKKCGQAYELTEYGYLRAVSGDSRFTHIPDWYRWERECVRREIEQNTYELDLEVSIYMIVDTKCVYRVGDGRLRHTSEGFHLTGCDGKLDYMQQPQASYSLYSDFYWYEIGDMISIGNEKVQYYCFPKNNENIVAKARLAAEELYKRKKTGKVGSK